MGTEVDLPLIKGTLVILPDIRKLCDAKVHRNQSGVSMSCFFDEIASLMSGQSQPQSQDPYQIRSSGPAPFSMPCVAHNPSTSCGSLQLATSSTLVTNCISNPASLCHPM